MNNLGFGTMRMPLLSEDQTDFDYEQINRMFDTFLDAGYTYFDTSFVYHNGKSENCVRKCLVERHPRDSFTVATKFPTFNEVPEDRVEALFQEQLDNVGVDFFDYYLLHNISTRLYDGVDGEGGIVKETHLFDHLRHWKEEGRAKNIGFSFHSSAELLDRVLTEHPEVDFVQLAINPIDWDSEMVQGADCYETVRRHGKKVVTMEMAKGGGLSRLPEEAEELLKALRPEDSITSWALNFSLEMEDVIAVLSGMSTIKQVQDNIVTAKSAHPFTPEETEALWHAMRLYRDSAPITPAQMEAFKGILWNNVPVTAILEAYSICQIQPDPGFSDDNNYFKNTLAEKAHLDLFGELPCPRVILPDGRDETELVEKAVDWLKDHSF